MTDRGNGTSQAGPTRDAAPVVYVPRCECCGEAPATEWHPDQDDDVWGYCAPCATALIAEWDALTPEQQAEVLRG